MSVSSGRRAGALLFSASLGVALAAPDGASAAVGEPGVIASFEGQWIDLSEGWGEAHACASDGTSTRCYRTEEEMDSAESRQSSITPMGVSAVCTSALKLYRSTGFAGDTLSLTTRGVTLSLAPYGFDNDTSSYKVGACSAHLYDTTSGTTSYPGSTAAGATASSMASGWDNRVGSVYIA